MNCQRETSITQFSSRRILSVAATARSIAAWLESRFLAGSRRLASSFKKSVGLLVRAASRKYTSELQVAVTKVFEHTSCRSRRKALGLRHLEERRLRKVRLLWA